MFSIIVPPVVVIFLVGVFDKRANGNGAFWTLVAGTLLGALLFILEQIGLWSYHYTTNVGIMVGISTLIFIVVSRMTSPPDQKQIELYLFRKELLEDGMKGLPWYKDYRFHMILLVIIMIWILVVFW